MNQSVWKIDWDLVSIRGCETYEYLIGKSIEKFEGNPIKEIDILRLYAGYNKMAESEKFKRILKEINEHCEQQNSRMKNNEAIRIKIKRLVSSYKVLLGKRKVRSTKERQRQENYVENIHKCFNVAVESPEQMSHETLNGSVDDSSNSNHSSDFGSSNHSSDFGNSNHSSSISSVSSNNDDNSIPDNSSDRGDDSDPDDSDPDSSDSEYTPDDDDDDEFQVAPKNPVPEPLLKEVAKSKASYRTCENLLKVGVKITNGIPEHYSLSKTTLWSRIVNIRQNQRTDNLQNLATSTGQIVVQFDGKRCHKLNARHLGNEERLVVLCHTEHCDIPLGFVILNSHTGYECAEKIMELIELNGLGYKIVGVVCDTENVNTGTDNGAVHLLEDMLKFDLLHLLCRHHMFEIVLKDVFTLIFGASTASEFTTFQFLKENWEIIKRNRYEYEPMTFHSPFLRQISNSARGLLTNHAEYFRNDYAELIDLSLKFLGENTDKSFHVPGATNNARWMSRAIYALKSFLFRAHIGLDDDFENSLQRFCMFVALIYVKFWNQCSNAADAPYNDIQFLKELDAYKQVDPEVAAIAYTAMKRHLWYLGDELVALALFSPKVSAEDKNEMCLMLKEEYGERTHNSIRYTDDIGDIQNLRLHSFISDRSSFLLNLLQIDMNFLSEDAHDWENIESYQAARNKVNKLITVVNDSAERAIQLGAKLISEQRVQTEARLQDFIVSEFH